MRDTIRSVVAVAGLVAVTACAHGTQAGSSRLTPPEGRITDEAIFRDYRAFGALEDRVRALNVRGVALADYHLAKAQAYLDLAFDEYHENDRSAVTERALAEAARLLTALEGRGARGAIGAALPMATYPLEGADAEARPEARTPENRLRPDLWTLAERLKSHPQFACAAALTARLEVALLHAIHEDHAGGWRRSRPHIESAEAFAERAQTALDACAR